MLVIRTCSLCYCYQTSNMKRPRQQPSASNAREYRALRLYIWKRQAVFELGVLFGSYFLALPGIRCVGA